VRPLNIGITCYSTLGGSGIVATQLGMAMATRGHQVHFICRSVPKQVDPKAENVHVHCVTARDYPVFDDVPYSVALSSKMIAVAQQAELDVLHVHYAVPHAVSAYLAAQVLGDKAPRVVTTLHGTDITLVGSDPTYLPMTRFSIAQSDAVTTPSQYLRDEARRRLDLSDQPIEVIGNFVDTARFRPIDATDGADDALAAYFPDPPSPHSATLVHVSNFRPVKRVLDVVRACAAVNAVQPVRLLLIGEGPDRAAAEAEVTTLGLADRVAFAGARLDVETILPHCDVFLLPSASESFGLAALEAMSAGLPVVASRVGGLPEVVAHGETGLLTEVGSIESIRDAVLQILTDSERLRAMSHASRGRAETVFAMGPAVDTYEALYRRLL
jgi:N-acetyl-alpha-D-glucosaminyl L-malate synthase BshA